MSRDCDRSEGRQYGKYPRQVSLILLFVPFLLLALIFGPPTSRVDDEPPLSSRRTMTHEHVSKVQQYNQEKIISTAPSFRQFHPRLLIFDGKTDTFSAYNLDFKDGFFNDALKDCPRCGIIIPILVDSLRKHFPERFSKGQASFQMMFTEADATHTACVNNPEECETESFAPIAAFSSVPKNSIWLPSVTAFPVPPFMRCIVRWLAEHEESCSALRQVDSQSIQWSDLQPQVIWRGSDFSFLAFLDRFRTLNRGRNINDTLNGRREPSEDIISELTSSWDSLTPRWRAVLLTLKAEADATAATDGRTPWIDSRFFGSFKNEEHEKLNEAGVRVTADEYMGYELMSKYRYQVDFGGGGGTSWTGTLTKLGMPGLLFHHETPMMDWFYNDMKPWVHYVPIKWDLSDLRAKYEWAEENPEDAEKIANAGTQLFFHLTSGGYIESVYKKLFIRHLGELIDAYQPSQGEDIASILKRYRLEGFSLYHLSTCGKSACSTKRSSEGPLERFFFIK